MQLYGKSRREAVSFLKEVPPPFTLVCCRRLFDDEASVDEPRTMEPALLEAEVQRAVCGHYVCVLLSGALQRGCSSIKRGSCHTLSNISNVSNSGFTFGYLELPGNVSESDVYQFDFRKPFKKQLFLKIVWIHGFSFYFNLFHPHKGVLLLSTDYLSLPFLRTLKI